MNTHARFASCRRLLAACCLGLVTGPLVAYGQADVALQKSVDVAVPDPGQPVQFTVRASNLGSRDATAVLVRDQLPPGLVAPEGTGVFVSAGDYDAATGAWSISQLAAGGEATLVMPAVVAMASPPACLVNVAENATQDDADDSNDRATAAVKQDAAVRCVDLAVAFQAIAMVPPVCSASRYFDFFVEVANRGPDAARDVIVDLAQSPQFAPGLRFVGSQCSGTRCRFDSIDAGSTRPLLVQSSTFTNTQSRKLRFTLAASTVDIDYATADNQASVEYVLTPFLPCDDVDDFDDAYAVTGACFIATAAYGSPAERHVVTLRQFRDRVLRRSAAGRAFIDWYYQHSPPVARYIAGRPWARAAARALLAPVVAVVVAPWRTLAAVLLLILVALAWRRRSRVGS
jgi:uncharacterized repeat protein (TIGR01451 family)